VPPEQRLLEVVVMMVVLGPSLLVPTKLLLLLE